MNEAVQRSLMVARQLEARGIRDRRVLDAMRKVSRHVFVSASQRASAYSDHPLPIGEGQTISQPYMVAIMTELLMLSTGRERVLEIGTGSGYQTAVLAELADRVFSIERLSSLTKKAAAVLESLGLLNRVSLRTGDGSCGWPESAPFNAILVTAGSPRAPEPLLEQLAAGGTLVVPVGDRHSQILEVHRRSKTDSSVDVSRTTPCRFVDLVGRFGWPD